MLTPMDYVRQGVKIPGSEWVLHPAVPVGMMERHKKAQRASTLRRLMKKTGEQFDLGIAGVIRIVPNGDKFYPVIGATRAEYAKLIHGPDYTMPAEILSREADVKEMAKLFMDELVSNPPGTEVKHEIGVVTGRQKYLDVENAREALLYNKSIGALTMIRQQKDGGELLKAVVAEVTRLWPRDVRNIPASVLRGVAHVLTRKNHKPIQAKWKRIGPKVLQLRAREKKAKSGGKSLMYRHVADLLVGRVIG